MAVTKIKPIKKTFQKSIAYILNPDKTEELVHISGVGVAMDARVAAKEFSMLHKKHSNKVESENSNKAHHLIISFKPGEIKNPDIALEIAEKVVKEHLKDNHQAVIAVHNDKEHTHAHIVFNAVGFNGLKYNGCKETYREIREITDNQCKEYNLSIVEDKKKKSMEYTEWDNRKKGTSWKQDIEKDIDMLIPKINSVEQLYDNLRAIGYEVKDNVKYVSVKPKGKERFVRLKTLGPEYEVERLKERINDRENAFEAKKFNKRKAVSDWIDKDIYRFRNRRADVGCIVELTGQLIRTQLGLSSNNRKVYFKENKVALEEIEVISKAIISIEKYKIEKREDIPAVFKSNESEIKGLEKFIKNARNIEVETRLSLQDKIKLAESNKQLSKLINKRNDIRNVAGVIDLAENIFKDELEDILSGKDKTFDNLESRYMRAVYSIKTLILEDNVTKVKYDNNKPYSIKNDYTLNNIVNQLNYIRKENINSELELMEKFNVVKELAKATKETITTAENKLKVMEDVISNGERYMELKGRFILGKKDKAEFNTMKELFTKHNIETKEDIESLKVFYEKSKEQIFILKNDLENVNTRLKKLNAIKNTVDDMKDNSLEKALMKLENSKKRNNRDFER